MRECSPHATYRRKIASVVLLTLVLGFGVWGTVTPEGYAFVQSLR